jgi:hypothetical protein
MNKSLCFSLIVFLFSTRNALPQTYGVYDFKGNLEKKVSFEKIDFWGENVVTGKNSDGLFLLSSDFRPMLNLQGTEVTEYISPWIIVKGPNGLGAFHEYGQLALPLEYEEIRTYKSILLAKKGNGYWVYEKGKDKISSLGSADLATLTHHGMVILKKGDKFLLPLSKTPEKEFQLLSENEGDFLLAKEASGYGLINREGDYVLNPVVDNLEHTKGDNFYGYDENQYLLIRGDDIRAQVSYNSYHKITKDGDLILEYIHGKLRRVMKEDGILLDAVGMESVTMVGKDLYNVRFRENKLGLLGEKGWLVQPLSATEWIGAGSEGLFPAKKGGKLGFVTSSGQWIISPQFTEVSLFSEGLAAYRNLSSWGLIDAKGKVISESKWDEIQSFKSGLAIAKYKNSFFLLQSDGEPVNQGGFDRITRLENGYFLVEFNSKSGLLDRKGTTLLPMEFEKIAGIGKNLFVVTKDGKEGLIFSEGASIFPNLFEDIEIDITNGKVLAKEFPVQTPAAEIGKKRKKGAKSSP